MVKIHPSEHVHSRDRIQEEEANRIGEIVTDTIDRKACASWGAQVNPEREGELKVTSVMTRVRSPRMPSRLGTIAPRLFNLEPYSKPDKPLRIPLDLYQMERP